MILNRMWRIVVAVAIAAALFLQTAVSPAMAQQILPHPDDPFSGKIGLTVPQSVPDKPELKLPSTFGIENAPNILVVMLDDVGYGQFGTFGSPIIQTPTMDRVA
ncbi:hypothetical protein [Coleofasciculus sp. F4-SAH-05]|uniref:hypothetical protein n=1 Tax=Coleofasciculus sp. F4-SAH-05 TaxID=3069525 RepID=UPI0032F6E5A5